MMSENNIALFNESVKDDDARTIVNFALSFAKSPLITTSFGAHSAAILYMVTRIKPDIQVVWCDTGYNTDATYRHAQLLIEKLSLNIEVFKPRNQTGALGSETFMNGGSSFSKESFARNVKLEPFERAMNKYRPDVWFTTIRKNQTAYRDKLDVFSITNDGNLRVSPFYNYTDDDIKAYLKQHRLPVEYDYFDPLKVNSKEECGIQLRS